MIFGIAAVVFFIMPLAVVSCVSGDEYSALEHELETTLLKIEAMEKAVKEGREAVQALENDLEKAQAELTAAQESKTSQDRIVELEKELSEERHKLLAEQNQADYLEWKIAQSAGELTRWKWNWPPPFQAQLPLN